MASGWGASEAVARYEAIREVLPQTRFPNTSRKIRDVSEVIEQYDAFVLDAFGVLNVGDTAIPEAVERVAQMRRAGRSVIVLTNGASFAKAKALAKYHRLGFDFAPEDVIASRDIAAAALGNWPRNHVWAAITAPEAGFEDIPFDLRPLARAPDLLRHADGFVFLGSEGWTADRQMALIAALRDNPRPVLVANPDIVAPRETGFSLEPGHFVQDIAQMTGTKPLFFGKPHANAFAAVKAVLPRDIAPERIAMVGDTLHTDVLGGRAAGFGTVLIAGHGLFAGQDPTRYIASTGIVPDVIADTT
ncbi:MAG: HAD-IIA family hydrolase [Rhodobacteraceae bacterium]|nr:MAG: HAD-IIA family hydrolase [Paracoccaceae bacterium]